MASLDGARRFLLENARVLERRLFATVFDGEPARGVVDALRAYRNDDGGFGHGLEPDKRCPDSQPLDVEQALETIEATGAWDDGLAAGACDFLASIAAPDGAVSLLTPAVLQYPRASHITEWTLEPGINPTCGLVGLLCAHGVEHPWLARATDWCWDALAKGDLGDAHAVKEALRFLEHAPDRARADELAPAVTQALFAAGWFRADAESPEYGVTPLHVAPTPDSRWHAAFGDDVIAAHLDRLERDQQPDSGWPITWEPPSRAAELEYRGVETVRVLRTLRAYGRL